MLYLVRIVTVVALRSPIINSIIDGTPVKKTYTSDLCQKMLETA